MTRGDHADCLPASVFGLPALAAPPNKGKGPNNRRGAITSLFLSPVA